MTYRFDTKVELNTGKHDPAMIAHIKYTLTNEENRDTVLCLIVRKVIPVGQTASDAHATAKKDSVEIEDILYDLAEEHGWLD
jgi:hypothetical protein